MPGWVWEPALTFVFPDHPVCLTDPPGAGEHPLHASEKTKAAATNPLQGAGFSLLRCPVHPQAPASAMGRRPGD